MDFSILMAYYHRDDPSKLKRAIQSIKDQTVRPKEIILVQDGPVSELLSSIIETFTDLPIKQIKLPINLGLINALNIGIKHATCPWIARMDSDDVSLPKRFELQTEYLKNHPHIDVLGGQIEEFSANSVENRKMRRVPIEHKDIIKYMRYRCPFNHMTVMYRKAIFDSGINYPAIPQMEDYGLWATLASENYKLANLPFILVQADATDLAARRTGFKQLIAEWRLQKHLQRHEVINLPTRYFNLFLRGSIRIFPIFIVKYIYNSILRERSTW